MLCLVFIMGIPIIVNSIFILRHSPNVMLQPTVLRWLCRLQEKYFIVITRSTFAIIICSLFAVVKIYLPLQLNTRFHCSYVLNYNHLYFYKQFVKWNKLVAICLQNKSLFLEAWKFSRILPVKWFIPGLGHSVIPGQATGTGRTEAM